MDKEAIEKAISEMPEYVPIRLIERKLGMPKTTLQKVLKGQRVLPKKWGKPLKSFFTKKEAVKVADQTKPNKEIKPPDQPKTNYTVNTNIPPMPTRNPDEDPFDFAARKNEWKKKHGV